MSHPHSSSSICPGCKHSFSRSGLSRHISTTSNTICIAARTALEQFGPSDIDSNDSESSRQGSPSKFDGDFFGSDYCEADFGWDDKNDSDHLVESDDNLSDDPKACDDPHSNIDNNEKTAWEPPAEPVRDVEMGSAEEEPQDDDMEGDKAMQTRMDSEQGIHQKPFVVPFLQGKAGQVIGQTQGQYAEYEGIIEKSTLADSEYAPFSSKLEWEFAKWAKTRGPGSTAVSELLKIEGVREILL